MSATREATERPSRAERASRPERSARRSAPASLVGAALPQVNLLPESVRAGQRLREVRGWFGLAVLVSVLLVAGGWFAGTLVVSDAQGGLTAEQDRTSALLADKARYAAVTPVMTDLDRADRASLVASGGEVLWADYLGAVTAVLPENVSLQTFSTQLAGADGGVTTADPLVTPGIAAITFTGTASAAPDIASLIDSLNSVTGFADARVSVVQRNDQELYDVTASVQVTADALSGRLMGSGQG